MAIVKGQPEPANGVIELPLEKVPAQKRRGSRWRKMVGGKRPLPRYQTLQSLGPDHALLQLQPQTGRTHQLRVHLAASGHPLVGDALYQMPDEAYLFWVQNGRSPSALPLLQRQALHCAATQFSHPITGEPCRLEAPLPPRHDAVDNHSQSDIHHP
ncbi:MAG: pseudouridine synthase [Chloroflexi bacterium]|nr:pseudouridine synthase [Chloroflexota bacterium]